MGEKIYFKNSKGINLCAILSNQVSKKDGPIIILCHGFSTSKDSYTNIRMEEILNKHNIATFRFDFFGHGESEGKFEDITISEAVDDIRSSIKYLKHIGYSKFGLLGSSFGGIASIIAASRTDELYVLALKSPVSDYEEKEYATKSREELEVWKKKGYKYYMDGDSKGLRLNYSFFEDFKNNNGYIAAKRIKIPTLIVHGDKDESVPIEQSRKIARIIKSCKLEIIDGADHRYSKPRDFERMLYLLSKFIIDPSN